MHCKIEKPCGNDMHTNRKYLGKDKYFTLMSSPYWFVNNSVALTQNGHVVLWYIVTIPAWSDPMLKVPCGLKVARECWGSVERSKQLDLARKALALATRRAKVIKRIRLNDIFPSLCCNDDITPFQSKLKSPDYAMIVVEKGTAAAS